MFNALTAVFIMTAHSLARRCCEAAVLRLRLEQAAARGLAMTMRLTHWLRMNLHHALMMLII